MLRRGETGVYWAVLYQAVLYRAILYLLYISPTPPRVHTSPYTQLLHIVRTGTNVRERNMREIQALGSRRMTNY